MRQSAFVAILGMCLVTRSDFFARSDLMVPKELDEGHSELLAAQLSLLVLRATLDLPSSGVEESVAIWPSTSAVPPRRAAEILAGLPKPVLCNASEDAGVLFVKCRSMTPAELEDHRTATEGITRSLRDGIVRLAGTLEPDPLVEVRTLSESRSFRFSTITTWLPEYRMAYGSLLDRPDDSARSVGASAVLFVGPTIEMRMRGGPTTPPKQGS